MLAGMLQFQRRIPRSQGFRRLFSATLPHGCALAAANAPVRCRETIRADIAPPSSPDRELRSMYRRYSGADLSAVGITST